MAVPGPLHPNSLWRLAVTSWLSVGVPEVECEQLARGKFKAFLRRRRSELFDSLKVISVLSSSKTDFNRFPIACLPTLSLDPSKNYVNTYTDKIIEQE